MTTLHVTGRILLSAEEVIDELWVIDGRISFTPPTTGANWDTVSGWVVPGFVDAHCHVGLGKEGAVDAQTSEAQALAILPVEVPDSLRPIGITVRAGWEPTEAQRAFLDILRALAAGVR